ncbi:MAG: hypothetical protein QXS41_01815 [Candidatus Woesearchaeota archaeon]
MFKYKAIIAFEDSRLENVLKIACYSGERSKSKIKDKKIYILAKDATSLRATLDGFIKAMKIFETTEKIN